MDEESSDGDGVMFRLTQNGAERRQASTFETRVSTNVQSSSGTSEADFFDALYGKNPDISFTNGADVNEAGKEVLPLQYPPVSTLLDNSNYTSETLNPDRTPEIFQRASAVTSPPSSSLESNATHGSTTQSIDDFIMNFAPDTKSLLSFEDRSILDTGMLFEHGSHPMLGAGLSHTGYASTGASSASFSPNETSTTLSARTPLPLSAAITNSSHGRRPGSTRRVTIQAVCPADELGKVVQAVMERAFSAVVKTDDQMSFDTG